MKTLIIVESPSKAKTISKFVDANVIASKGHIRDLPKNRLGINISDGHFIPEYEVSKDHAQIVKELKALAKDSKVLLATDEDREGEAIAFHIASILGKDVKSYDRIVFHEITKTAILNAIKNPRKIDLNSVNAQQARRMLDRIVGFKLSNLLSSKVESKLSAGRVQSAALRLIVLREREIKAFKSVDYYEVKCSFKDNLEAQLIEFNNEKVEKLSFLDEKTIINVLDSIKNDNFFISEISTKKQKSSPKAPFMTSTLQQAASSKLGFSPKKTMMLAQSLYEGVQTHTGFMGAITYMRTDSLNLSTEAINAARNQIEKDYGKDYVASKPRVFTTKSKGAQEAHEAIRVTNVEFTPKIAKDYLKADEYKLYKLIYDRFLMTQMADASIENESVIVKGKNSVFKISGRKMLFDGYLKLNDDVSKDVILPNLNKNDAMFIQNLESKQSKTEPPARFNEASLIKKLEELGIGRPSTYAPTTSLLIDRKYVNLENKQLIPSERGEKITDFLEEYFLEIVDANFTSNMENKLDEIATDGRDLNEVLYEFYEPFITKINDGKNIKSQKEVIELEEKCPECSSSLVIRSGRFGKFIACSAYPKCKYSRNLEEKTKENDSTNELPCPSCGGVLVLRKSKRGEFYGCKNYPKCTHIQNINNDSKANQNEKTLSVPCPSCGGVLVQRFSKKGAFFGCKNYPTCSFISKYEVLDKKCPECSNTLVLKELKKGNFEYCTECKFTNKI